MENQPLTEKAVSFGAYKMLVNVRKTHKWYDAKKLCWCDCAGCRNMEIAFHNLPQEVSTFLGALGVDPMCPGETAHYIGRQLSPDASEVESSVWYHICGKLLEGSVKTPSTAPDGAIVRYVDGYGEQWTIMDGWSVTFKKECDLIADDFPRPCFQMELWCTLPWLLDESNPYII